MACRVAYGATRWIGTGGTSVIDLDISADFWYHDT